MADIMDNTTVIAIKPERLDNIKPETIKKDIMNNDLKRLV